MNRIFLFLAFLYNILSVQTTTAQTIESCIAGHVTISKNDSDFSVLDNILKDKRIVILGEAGHWDGTTFGIRSKLTRHLIDDLGFDILGMESPSILGSQMLPDVSEQLTGKEFNLKDWYLAPIWNNTVECREIMDAIDRREIAFFGFDYDKTGAEPRLLNMLLQDVYPEYNQTFDLERFKRIHHNNMRWYPPQFKFEILSEEDDTYFCKVLNELENLCSRPVVDETSEQKERRELIKQSLYSFRVHYALSKVVLDKTVDFENDYNAIWQYNDIRDAYMADNIMWCLDHNPDKKMVIWCANFHGARNISQAEYPKLPGFYMRQKLMAEHLAERYGDQLYSLAFTTHRSDNNDSLEAILADSGVDFGFIDFGPLKYSDEFFNKPFKASMIGYKSGCWMSIFDGVYFHKYNRRPTYIDPEYGK